MNTDCAVVVLAKAPIAGYAKSRLVPVLGSAGAARLARRLLENAVEQAASARLGPVTLCCAPDCEHPAFRQLAREWGCRLTAQGEGDLGRRMVQALGEALGQARRVLLLGTDAPGLDAERLLRAAHALRSHDAVFVPALDGGYALVGLNSARPELFDDIEWSTSRVMQQTRETARRLGLRWAEMPALADIDVPADLSHLPSGWLDAGLAAAGPAAA